MLQGWRPQKTMAILIISFERLHFLAPAQYWGKPVGFISPRGCVISKLTAQKWTHLSHQETREQSKVWFPSRACLGVPASTASTTGGADGRYWDTVGGSSFTTYRCLYLITLNRNETSTEKNSSLMKTTF